MVSDVVMLCDTVTIIISGIVMLLSRVDAVFCFGNYFLYFPVNKSLLIYFILEAIFIDSYFRYFPRRQIFSDLFSMRFYWLFFG